MLVKLTCLFFIHLLLLFRVGIVGQRADGVVVKILLIKWC